MLLPRQPGNHCDRAPLPRPLACSAFTHTPSICRAARHSSAPDRGVTPASRARQAPRPGMARALALAGLVLLVSLLSAPAVRAWGHDGHLYVCALAQGLLSDTAAARVQALLPPWAKGYMPSVCSWADYIGHASKPWRWSLPLHYIDTPDNACNYDFSRDCHTRCVAAAILNYTSQLQSGDISNPRDAMPVVPPPKGLAERVAASAEQLDRLTSLGLGRSGHVPPLRAALDVLGGAEEAEESAMQAAASVLLEHLKGSSDSGSDPDPTVLDPTVALMFLVHFVGDIHQPLHVGFTSDYGGNRIHVHWYKKKTNLHEVRIHVHWYKKKTSLHEVWDTEIIKHGVWKYHGNKPTDFVLSMAKRLSGEWAPQIATWASCANGPVCPNTFAGESIKDACTWAYKDAPDGTTLEDVYFESRFPVVEVELAKAAVRLAATLNRIFPSSVEASAAK